MNKEDFLEQVCPEYEEACTAYQLFGPYLSVLTTDYFNLENLQSELERDLSQCVLSYLFGTYFEDDGTVYDTLEDDLTYSLDDGWSCCSITDHGVYVYIDDAKILVRELAPNHEIVLVENVNYTDSDFLRELNSEFDYKFYA